jgi:hypothetical protein
MGEATLYQSSVVLTPRALLGTVHFLSAPGGNRGKRCPIPDNPCGVAPPLICHFPGVTQLTALLSAHRPQIKIEWERVLRAVAVTSPLAHPDVLVHRMDDTCATVLRMLSDPRVAQWPTVCPAVTILRDSCRCGVNPLHAYFESGSAALKTMLPRLNHDETLRLEQAWYAVAHRELEMLCNICQRELRT